MKEFQPQSLKREIAKVLYKDRFYLNKLLKKLTSLSQKTPVDDKAFHALQQKLNAGLNRSETLLQQRSAVTFDFKYPSDLPVCQRKDEIINIIESNQVTIVAGETGSGKTTQLGKMCLELGRGRLGQIAHTQPRRVAATSVAKRIADELGQTLGKAVGYQIRFKDLSEDGTLLKLMTDGVLLAEVGHDKWLNKYDTLIIDEAHERSLNIDFLLGYLKQLLPKRPDLKVIITSATIDVERFSRHFNDAPVIEISGRTFDVEKRYRPLEVLSPSLDINEAIEQVLIEIDREEKANQGISNARDVLVFLTGENDIRQASLALRRSNLKQMEILPLYARLNQSEHEKIFRPSKKAQRRVILATNVAETSLTVPGIGYVIDSGLARISRYSHRSKIQRLPIEKIAKASAEQRAGRCGRIAKGICYRLYSEDDFNLREDFTAPEIQRTNLSQVILQMYALGLGDIEKFSFIQPPEQKLINDGIKQLVDLAALDEHRSLTPNGRSMHQWPLDPKLARMMIAAEQFLCVDEMMIIVSALACQNPREYPNDKKEAAREKHKQLFDASSDFLGLLNLWKAVEEQRQDLSNSQFRKYCQRSFLSWQRLKEWRDIHKQLRLIAKSLKVTINQEPADYDQMHKALLTGFASHIGFQDERFIFQGTRNRQFRLFPTTALYKKPPKWVVVADLLETSQLYGHTAARIEPEWVIETSSHLLKYQHFEPHFSRKQGRVVAYQKTSLYGLVLEEKKRVGYADIDSKLSHEIFIRSGLVEGQMQSKAPFYQHNIALKKDIENLEEKSRRRDLLVSDDDIYDFYANKIPKTINSVRSLERWLKTENDPSFLKASKSLFLKQSLDNAQADFPPSVVWQDVSYALSYRFQPGQADDGVCIRLPVTTLNRVPRFLFEWLVPGLLPEKCEAMLRALPKQYRRNLVPIPDTVSEVLPLLKADDKSLAEALCKALEKCKQIKIPVSAFQLEKLDNYYLPLFELRDDNNKVLEKSRDLGHLIKTYGHKVKQALDKKIDKQQTKAAKRWEFGAIEKQQQFKQSGTLITSFPALEDATDCVRLTLTDYPALQEKIHRKGLVRLSMLYLPQQVKYLRKSLLSTNHIQLKLTAEFQPEAMKQDLLSAAFNHCFFSGELPFDQAHFESLLNDNRQNLATTASFLEKTVQSVMDNDYEARNLLSKLNAKTHDNINKDIQRQRINLLYPGFIYQTPISHFKELPRYFTAIKCRLERLGNQLSKDLKYTESLNEINGKLDDVCKEHPNAKGLKEVVKLRWMMEEYRVSLFAQQLKTLYPISQKRIDKQWDAVMDEIRKIFV